MTPQTLFNESDDAMLAPAGQPCAAQRVVTPLFPALTALVRDYRPSRDVTLILITHVLPTAIEFIERLRERFEVHCVPIPYSYEAGTAGAYLPRLVTARDVAELGPLAAELIGEHCRRGRYVIAQEIGGYLASHVADVARWPTFLGVVEDTNNGHWNYATVAAAIPFPVISIARSPIKATEDVAVGEAVTFSVERIMRSTFSTVLRGKRAALLGYGRIGASCAAALQQRGCDVVVADCNPVSLMRARIDGFKTSELATALATSDLIVGASGRTSLRAEATRHIKAGALLVSASSKQIEFDIEGMRQLYTQRRVNPEIVMYTSEGRAFYLARDGYPVNFSDHSILGTVLDAVYSELFICVRELVEGRAPIGLNDSWPSIHSEVADRWKTAHVE